MKKRSESDWNLYLYSLNAFRSWKNEEKWNIQWNSAHSKTPLLFKRQLRVGELSVNRNLLPGVITAVVSGRIVYLFSRFRTPLNVHFRWKNIGETFLPMRLPLCVDEKRKCEDVFALTCFKKRTRPIRQGLKERLIECFCLVFSFLFDA